MHYQKVTELPQEMQESLSTTAQQQYLELFNRAWEQYKNDDSLTTDKERKTAAHREAWEVVQEQK